MSSLKVFRLAVTFKYPHLEASVLLRDVDRYDVHITLPSSARTINLLIRLCIDSFWLLI
jgi:hypothetical protein